MYITFFATGLRSHGSNISPAAALFDVVRLCWVLTGHQNFYHGISFISFHKDKVLFVETSGRTSSSVLPTLSLYLRRALLVFFFFHRIHRECRRSQSHNTQQNTRQKQRISRQSRCYFLVLDRSIDCVSRPILHEHQQTQRDS